MILSLFIITSLIKHKHSTLDLNTEFLRVFAVNLISNGGNLIGFGSLIKGTAFYEKKKKKNQNKSKSYFQISHRYF